MTVEASARPTARRMGTPAENRTERSRSGERATPARGEFACGRHAQLEPWGRACVPERLCRACRT